MFSSAYSLDTTTPGVLSVQLVSNTELHTAIYSFTIEQ